MGDPVALDLHLIERTAGVPDPLGHPEQAVSGSMDVAGEVAPGLGASEVDPLLAASLSAGLLVLKGTRSEQPHDCFLLRLEPLWRLRREILAVIGL